MPAVRNLRLAAALLTFLSAAPLLAQQTTLPLWPAGPPEAAHTTEPEHDTTKPSDAVIAGKPIIRLGNVSTPTLTLYSPQGNNTGAAVVVFPGGGYQILAIDLEGTEVCDWLNSIRHHLRPAQVPRPQHRPLSRNRLLPSKTPSAPSASSASTPPNGSIDPKRIGVLGFSAGAHLAAALGTHYDKRLYTPIDAADQLSCRPDFAFIIYPGYLAAL